MPGQVHRTLATLVVAMAAACGLQAAEQPGSLPTQLVSDPLPTPELLAQGEGLYNSNCAACHRDAPPEAQDVRMPRHEALQAFSSYYIVQTLTDGRMALQGATLSMDERAAIAAYLTGQLYQPRDLVVREGLCTDAPPAIDMNSRAQWNGWSPDRSNARFQNAAAGGITAAELPRLKLRWAYGLPQEQQARGQPSVVGERLFVGSQAGAVYALNAKTGCTYWTFQPRAGLRSAVTVAPITLADGTQSHAVFFIDRQAWVYAVDANTGTQLWSLQLETHPGVRATGALSYHEGRLYVPLSGIAEGNIGSNPDYPCCSFRGSLSALDANSGEILWQTYTVDEPQPRGTSNNGVALWGPSGVGIWAAPTIDARRRLVYAGTGPAYSGPAPATTDAVIAFDMDNGAIRWVNQFTVDVWAGGCGANSAGNPNCPDDVGPDIDFNASPILTTTSAGKELIVIPQKSGELHALDPDNNGATLWSYRAGPGGPVGGVWGSAVEGDTAYVAVSGFFNAETGGIHAVHIPSGERLWYTPPQDLLCAPAGPGCSPTQAAALTAVPGAVFSGAADGGLRAYDAKTGEILWVFDANRSFDTVNGVPANGASFDGPGPVIAGGMMYVLSGDAGFVGRPGNVLLAFSVEEE
jgi:polyvinyl alcohol dehydrogenase (cytochrome)